MRLLFEVSWVPTVHVFAWDLPRVTLFAMAHAPTTWLALLRGINVGSANVVKMAELRAHLAGHGFEEVRTYIQSGNVIWHDTLADRKTARERVTGALDELFGHPIDAVVVPSQFIEMVVARAPARFAEDKQTLRCDVMYLMPDLNAHDVVAALPLREGVDEATAGPGVIYFSRTIEGNSRSKLSRIVGTPIYQRMTIRNWNTTRKLSAMLA